MADAELVFPHTKVQAAAQDLVTVAVMVVVALVAVWQVLVAHEGGVGSAAVVVATLLGARVAAMYTALEDGKALVRRQMTDALYEKLHSSERGVLLSLTHSMEEQECKEALLVIWTLLHAGKKRHSRSDLNALGNKLVKQFCGLDVGFSVSDAVLRQLCDDHVIDGDADRFSGRPIAHVNRALDAVWDDLYNF